MSTETLMADWTHHFGGVIPSEVTWDSEDPLCLCVTFRDGSGTSKWQFSRDLLRDAYNWGKSGEADVQATYIPSSMFTSSVLTLTLTSPTGVATLRTEGDPVASFLDRTYKTCPRGSEYIDVDKALEEFFS